MPRKEQSFEGSIIVKHFMLRKGNDSEPYYKTPYAKKKDN